MIKKHTPKIVFICLAVVMTTAILLTNSTTQATGADTLTLSPASGSYTTGTTFTVGVYENSYSDSINSADADLLFNSSQLQYISNSTSQGAFSSGLCIPSTSASEVNIGCTLISGSLTGSQLIETVTFKALTASSTAITFGSQSAILLSSGPTNVWNNASAGATYTLAAPVQSGGGSTSGGSSPSSGSSGGSSGGTTKTTTKSSTSTSHATAAPATTATPSTTTPSIASPTSTSTAPVISNIKVSGVTINTATVSWQTNVPATSDVQFGTTSKYGLSAQSSSLTTTHQVSLTSPDLIPATHYDFVVVSAASSGASTTSAAQAFSTLGFGITIRVVDAHGKIIKGAVVTLDGHSLTTNNSGIVTFQDTPGGPQPIVIKVGDAVTKRVITVSGSNITTGNSTLQQFSLSAARASSNVPFEIIGLTVVLVVGAAAIFRTTFINKVLKPAGIGVDPDIDKYQQVMPITSDDSVPSTIEPTSPTTDSSVTSVSDDSQAQTPSSTSDLLASIPSPVTNHAPGTVVTPNDTQSEAKVTPDDDVTPQEPLDPPETKE
jgi:hypothetical protein